MKIVILDMLNNIISEKQWSVFDVFYEVVKYDNTTPDEVVERIKDADGIIVNKVSIGKKEIDCAKNLKYIGVVATGYDIVDVAYANEKNITVTNVPSYGTDTVAEFTFAMMFALSRKIELHNKSVKDGNWKKANTFSYNLTPQFDLNGKTLGIIGYGKIGRRVSEIAKAFKMNVLVLDRRKNYRIEDNISFVSLDELLSNSDFVSLHCNLTEENFHMVNKEFLDKMKSSSYLINVSRGDLVNENDLAYGLNNDIIAGAGVDAVSEEPIQDNNPLLKAKNIIITPHMAWLAKEAVDRILNIAVDNLKKYNQGIEQNRII